MLYLRWARFAIDHALRGRCYVILNMDETSLSTVEDQSRGLRTCRRTPRGRVQKRQEDIFDRSNRKTTLLAVVCDSRELQPYLPQIVLARYTKSGMPPAHILDACTATGEPLEYWHGTGGWASSATIKNWATRARSIVHSFNPDAWILLIWDCSQTHLNLQVARHLRRLGVLVLFIPAKLTGLLQLLDVCVFKELKTRIRMEKTSIRCRDREGRLRVGDWISSCGAAIRDVIVERCWEDSFDRMGLGASIESVSGRVRRAVNPTLVEPRLPNRAEFARMVNRVSDTEGFRALHANVVGHFVAVSQLPLGTAPPRGALLPIPDVEPARQRHRIGEPDGLTWEQAMDRDLERLASDHRRRPHGRAGAVHRNVRPPEEI
jgi:hypothetical protein